MEGRARATGPATTSGLAQRLMTLSSRNIHRSRQLFAAAMLLAMAGCASVPPPTAEMAAAEQALAAAEALQPRGHAATPMNEARRRFEVAQSTLAEQRYEQARMAAIQAQAAAELARARALLAESRDDHDSKAARNADLRRAQLRQGGN